jgi:DNA-binding CsgD family transcriptional regulator
MTEAFRSGDALFAFGEDLTILSWNAAAEQLTGIPAEAAIGRPCWDVLGAVDERGSLVCHAGCSGARLVREGWPVPCRLLHIRTADHERKTAWVSTVAVKLSDGESVFLHLLRNGESVPDHQPEPTAKLTPRQHQILGMLAEGLPAKVIAARLGIAQVTVRNHIQAILTELRCHSQLEAVAVARRTGLL